MSFRFPPALRAFAAVAAVVLAAPAAALLTTSLSPAPAVAAPASDPGSGRAAPAADHARHGPAAARPAPMARHAPHGPAAARPALVRRPALARDAPLRRRAPGPGAVRDVPVRRVPDAAAPFRWPVDAPLVDRFRPPATPYSRGNRGIDFDTATGQLVVAAAPGEVVFAGAVGHTLHVVVLHAGGVRTSYSFLQRVDVRRGQQVERGDVVGRAGATLHFGVRVGASYVDPLAFLGLRPPLRPYLVQDRDSGSAASRWK